MTTLQDLATLVGGTLAGDGRMLITGAEILREAQPGEISLADRAALAGQLAESRASAVVVPRDFRPEGVAYIAVDHVHRAFAAIVSHFRPPLRDRAPGIHPTAWVDPTARLGADVYVGPQASIGAEAVVGAGCAIHAGARVMERCVLGERVTLYPNVVLYENTRIGNRCQLHAGAVIGAHGFGFETSTAGHAISSQLGYVAIEDDCEIGANTTIDRGTYGATTIGAGTKTDNQVQVAHNCRIGRQNLFCAQVGIGGSVVTGERVILAGQVGVRDHCHIGDNTAVGAKSGVGEDLPANGRYHGTPAIPVREQAVIYSALSRLPAMRQTLKRLERQVSALRGESPDAGGDRDAA